MAHVVSCMTNADMDDKLFKKELKTVMPNRKPSNSMSRVNVGSWASLVRRRQLGQLFQPFKSGVRKGLPGPTTKRPRSAPPKHPSRHRNPLVPPPKARLQKSRSFYGEVLRTQLCTSSTTAPTQDCKFTLPRTAQTRPRASLPNWQLPLSIIPEEQETGMSRSQRPRSQCVFD